MIPIGVYLVLMAVLVVASLGRVRRSLSIALGRDFVSEPMSGLTPSESARLARWAADVEAAGFHATGDFRTVPHAAPEDGSERVSRLRFWTSEDRRTVACATLLVMIVKIGETATESRSLQLSIVSRSADRTYETVWMPSRTPVPSDPRDSVVRFPVPDARAMVEAHRARLSEPLVEIADPTATLQELMRREVDRQVADGWLLIKGGNAVGTAKYTKAAMAMALNPLTGEPRRPMVNAMLFVVVAAISIVGAWLAEQIAPGWPAAAAWMTLVWLAADAAFPNTAIVASPLIAAAAAALHPTAWIPATIAAVVSVFTRGAIQSWRSKRLQPAAEPVPGLNLVRGVSLIFGALAGVAIVLFLRQPRESDLATGYLMLVILGMLGLVGAVVLASFVLRWIPSVRTTPGYRLLRAGETGLFLVLVGLMAGLYFADQDRKVTEERAAAIIEAIERRPAPPAALAELGIAIPAPRIGWKAQEFHYEVRGVDWFLSYLGPGSRMVWDRPARRWRATGPGGP